jgi:antitoxin component HigA of HigAB toxin-antitoxin module
MGVFEIATDGLNIYVFEKYYDNTNDYEFLRLDITKIAATSTQERTLLFTATNDIYTNIAYHDNYIYFFDKGVLGINSHKIVRVSANQGSLAVEEVKNELNYPNALNVIGNHLYYTEDGGIFFIDLATNDFQTTTVLEELVDADENWLYPEKMTVTTSGIIYFMEFYSSKIYQLTLAHVGVATMLDISENLYVYPNPANKSIVVHGVNGQQEYTVLTINGQIVYKGLICNHQDVDLQHLVSGVYFIRVGTSSVMKFVKN